MEFPRVSIENATASRRQFVARLTVGLASTAAATLGASPQTHGSPLATGDRNLARLLSDDSTSLLHRLQLIDAAQREIYLSAYEIGDDLVALRILAGLRAAARRGVDVRLLVDGHGVNNLIAKPMMEHLVAESVCIKEHMPDVRYKLEIGRQRMHDKLLIVDGHQLIIGGRNVRADYYGMSCEPTEKNRWDCEAYVSGPIAEEIRCYFLARWRAGTSGQPTLDRDEKKKTVKAQRLAYLNDLPRARAMECASRLLDDAWSAPLPYSHSCCDQHQPDCDCEPFFQLECVKFLHDEPEHAKDCPVAIAQQISNVVQATRQSLLISTPYLVLTRAFRERLTDLRRRGVEVCLLTNSLATTNRAITHAQYANERRWMLGAGIELWEMTGERMLHAKSMIIDGYRSMIGSYNFDVLSETRNSETALLIDDARFAGVFTAHVARHLTQAVPVSEPLFGFDARTNDVDERELHKLRTKRMISPWIKKYL